MVGKPSHSHSVKHNIFVVKFWGFGQSPKKELFLIPQSSPIHQSAKHVVASRSRRSPIPPQQAQSSPALPSSTRESPELDSLSLSAVTSPFREPTGALIPATSSSHPTQMDIEPTPIHSDDQGNHLPNSSPLSPRVSPLQPSSPPYHREAGDPVNILDAEQMKRFSIEQQRRLFCLLLLSTFDANDISEQIAHTIQKVIEDSLPLTTADPAISPRRSTLPDQLGHLLAFCDTLGNVGKQQQPGALSLQEVRQSSPHPSAPLSQFPGYPTMPKRIYI